MARKNRGRQSGKILFILAVLIVAGIAGINTNAPSGLQSARPTATVQAIATPCPATIRPSAVTSLAQSNGHSPQIAEDDGPVRCDYIRYSTQRASIEWTDGAQAYTITGHPDHMSRLYLDMLELDDWQSCQYYVKHHAQSGYGVGINSAYRSDSLKAYIDEMRDTLGVKPTPSPTPVKYEYVLNNESKIFHRPSCHQASRIKGKKRQVVTTTREKLLSKGYKPCGVCTP